MTRRKYFYYRAALRMHPGDGIHIPIQIRDEMNLNYGDEVEVRIKRRKVAE